jgi:hypothetical protein
MCIYKRLEREKKLSCRSKVKRGQKSLAQQPEYEKGKKCNDNKKGERKKKNAHPITHRIFALLSSKNLLGTFFSPQI